MDPLVHDFGLLLEVLVIFLEQLVVLENFSLSLDLLRVLSLDVIELFDCDRELLVLLGEGEVLLLQLLRQLLLLLPRPLRLRQVKLETHLALAELLELGLHLLLVLSEFFELLLLTTGLSCRGR